MKNITYKLKSLNRLRFIQTPNQENIENCRYPEITAVLNVFLIWSLNEPQPIQRF